VQQGPRVALLLRHAQRLVQRAHRLGGVAEVRVGRAEAQQRALAAAWGRSDWAGRSQPPRRVYTRV
jgi:hypothetical protein